MPDKLVLELHAHQHNNHRQTTETDLAKLEPKHNHCPTEHLFNNPFCFTQTLQGAQIVSYSGIYQVSFASAWKFAFPNNSQFRGPPVS